MRISIVGTGYVGLVSGVCLAEKGHDVVCVDKDATKVDAIKSGKSPIYEVGLEDLLQRNIGLRLNATTNLGQAVAGSEVTLIAVGTPFDGQAIDVSYIEAASDEIGAALRHKDSFHTVVVKSTVVPGTTDEVVKPRLEAASGKCAGRDFGVAMNPEFLREGAAVGDFMFPDRIVYGGINEPTLEVMDQVYAVFPEVDKLRTNNKTAEMIKYTANSLLATLISFSNEIGNLCTTLGDIDAVEVMKGVHLDRRLSPILESGERVMPGMTTYLEAGCGFGGSCFPKDVKALISHGERAGNDMRILKSVMSVNEEQPMRVLRLLEKHLGDLRGRSVAVLGLAFKPGTDDMRESPAIPIVRALASMGAQIRAYDPVAADEARQVFQDLSVDYADSLGEAIRGQEALVIVSRWDEFHDLPGLLTKSGDAPLVIDGRRMLSPNSVARYDGIGL